MLQDNATCKELCVSSVPPDDAKFINERILEDYALNWLVDGLPAAEMKIDVKSGDMFFDMGFNLGNDEGPHAQQPALNNHYDIVLRYDLFPDSMTPMPMSK
jgi:transmembrane 9 superfamily member 2/4